MSARIAVSTAAVDAATKALIKYRHKTDSLVRSSTEEAEAVIGAFVRASEFGDEWGNRSTRSDGEVVVYRADDGEASAREALCDGEELVVRSVGPWLKVSITSSGEAAERDILAQRLYVALVEQRVIDGQRYGEFTLTDAAGLLDALRGRYVALRGNAGLGQGDE